jgi:hypothetical protein
MKSEVIAMTREIVASALLVAAMFGAQASAKVHKAPKPRASASVTYDHDSRDPNVGWHWEGGMRTCHNDCDNPEIPGSGYTCKNVNLMGSVWRQCDKSN